MSASIEQQLANEIVASLKLKDRIAELVAVLNAALTRSNELIAQAQAHESHEDQRICLGTLQQQMKRDHLLLIAALASVRS